MSHNKTFEIWGDGKQVRDFIYIDDIISFVNRVVELDILKPMNIGSGTPINFIQLAQKMMKIYGVKKEIVFLKDKPVGCKFRCSDNTEMLKIYKPIYSLDERIDNSFSYFKNNNL